MRPSRKCALLLSATVASGLLMADQLHGQATESDTRISDEELALRRSISASLVGTWVGTFRVRNPETNEISESDYRLDYSWTRADGFLLGEGGLLRDGEVARWSHDVYSWDEETGDRYISFNGFGVPVTHVYAVADLNVEEDTPESWSFVRTHTGRVGRLGVIQQRVTIRKTGDRYHATTENRDPDADEDFEFSYEMVLERASE